MLMKLDAHLRRIWLSGEALLVQITGSRTADGKDKMPRQTDVLSPFMLNTFLSLLSLINPPSLAENFTSSRQIRLADTGSTLNFTWYLFYGTETAAAGKRAAQQICEAKSASLPRTHELRYFYKPLRQDITTIVPKPEDFVLTFYLEDVLDTTTDFPNEATGERMCIVLKSMLHEPLQYAETDGRRSCSQPVSVVVCRQNVASSSASDIKYQVPVDTQSPQGPLWLEDLKAKAAENDQQICIQRPLFYACTAVAAGCLILLTVSFAVLCCRYQRMHRLTARTTNPLFSTSYLQLASKSDSLKSNSLNVVSPLPEYVADITSSARYDLLQDSPPDLTSGPLSCTIRSPNACEGVNMEQQSGSKFNDEAYLKKKRKLETEATGFL